MATFNEFHWQVTCPCGWRARGTKDEVIQAVREHALREHETAITEQQAAERATPIS